MEKGELLPHLFRTEYRKIIAVLGRRFGLKQIEIAEDIASETFLTASQTWGIKGVPPNPTAWLYDVAKKKAKNFLQRYNVYNHKVIPALKDSVDESSELDMSVQNINDSQLQMMFAICHPIISVESQIGLSLRILCGFGIEEIADAFLTNKETINKRLLRAKEKLREKNIDIEFPEIADLAGRLNNVLATLYLLFNEGYYSASHNKALRKDLCLEAMRLCTTLIENKSTNTPSANALQALMCFHASRFEARIDKDGAPVLYDEQDIALWNTDLISKGGYFLRCAQEGNELSKYHLEAGIAWWHTQKEDTREKWENILQFYNRLLQMEYSPVAALNRTYALSKVQGKSEAIKEAERLSLTDNPFYFGLLGELYTDIDPAKARQHYQAALSMVKNQNDRQQLQRKINKLA